ncbi:MAG: heterodisulfide reductase subunit [Clostridia bacterium]|nr:heterodisulfide reductase subunit [Clostridia bacterium]
MEMERNQADSLCCGGGGNLEMVNQELSAEISKLKVEMIKKTGARTVISGCQQCKRTISGAVRKEKARVRVQDLTEFILASIEE